MPAATDAIERTVLANGLRVVTAHREGTPLAAVKVFFKVGSRHDGAHPGIAHFLEHVLFTGPSAAPRPTVYAAVEAVGGEANAVTTREYTALQAVMLAPHLEMVVSMFADLLRDGAPDEAAVGRERGVILEEIARTHDSVQVIWDLLLRALWGDHSLARPVTGTPDSVMAITGDDLGAHLAHYLAADRIVIAAAGRVDHEALVRTAEAQFGRLPRAGPLPQDSAAGGGPGRTFMEKDIRQTHLAFGLDAPPLPDPRRHAVRLVDIILGRGASSRLHRALRGSRGLVYDVSTVAMGYEDRGYIAVHTACAPERVAQVSALVVEEMERLARHGATQAELDTAKTNYEGSLARNFETVLSLAGIIGIEELLHRIEPFAESVARVRAVTVERLQDVASELLHPERLAVAAIGRPWADA